MKKRAPSRFEYKLPVSVHPTPIKKEVVTDEKRVSIKKRYREKEKKRWGNIF